MEKVIIRDVEEPEKTEIHTKIENTKEGLKKLARFFSLLVSDYNTNNILRRTQQNNVCGNKFRAILASVGYLI